MPVLRDALAGTLQTGRRFEGFGRLYGGWGVSGLG
jgi:hypothetical protein